MRDDGNMLALYMAYRGALVNYANGIVGDRAHAEDVVQEAWLRFGAMARQSPLEEPVGYLYRIVRNLAFDWKRHVAAEDRRDHAHELMLDPVPTAPSPEEEAFFRDELRQVEAALAELPDRVRLAFEMHRIGGYTFQQIAERLHVSIATAARWAQQALLHVAKRLHDPRD